MYILCSRRAVEIIRTVFKRARCLSMMEVIVIFIHIQEPIFLRNIFIYTWSKKINPASIIRTGWLWNYSSQNINTLPLRIYWSYINKTPIFFHQNSLTRRISFLNFPYYSNISLNIRVWISESNHQILS